MKKEIEAEENKIIFVGAGPGAADLITLRGQRLLEQADVIIYAGSLVNPALLTAAKEGCHIYDSSAMTLQEVIGVMQKAHRSGLRTVRLQTGDPCLYGALREQLAELKKLGIGYEICPGVSSFCGAAAALRTEFTLPGISQSVILTRMEGRTGVPEKEKLTALASHGASMVIFLSAGMTGQVQEALLAGAFTESTPCAVVYKATWPEERILRGCLGELERMTREAGITRTALIVVGDCLGELFELSRLYAPDFETGFRKARAGGEEKL